MKFSWFIALRYLKPRGTFVSVITVISVLGVALGVGVLLVVIAVMSGFEKKIKEELLKAEPAIFVQAHPDLWKQYSFPAGFTSPPEEPPPVPDSESPDPTDTGSAIDPDPERNPPSGTEQDGSDQTSIANAPPDSADTNPAETAITQTNSTESTDPTGPAGREAPSDSDDAVSLDPGPDFDVKFDFPSAGGADWNAVAAMVQQHPEVRSVSPVVTVTSVIERKPTPAEEEALDAGGPALEEVQTLLIGVDPEDTIQMERLQNMMGDGSSGSFELLGDSIMINQAMAERLNHDGGLVPGQTAINVFGPSFLKAYRTYYQEQQRARKQQTEGSVEAVEAKDRDLPLPEELLIQGILAGDKSGDQPTGYISLKNAQKLAGTGKGINGLTVELTDAFRAGEVKLDLDRNGLPDGWTVQTWMERNQRFFDAIANERGMMYLVLAFISIVAAFCIMNTMITMAVQKRKEIGMMRALGAKTSQIVGLFVVKGLVVAGFGVGTGYILGNTVLHFRNDIRNFISSTFQWQIFDERIYGLREIPADPRMLDNLLICGIAFVLCTLAAVPPALLVGRMDPARALRTDR